METWINLFTFLIILMWCFFGAFVILKIISYFKKSNNKKIYKPKKCTCKLDRDLCHSQLTYRDTSGGFWGGLFNRRGGILFERDMVEHFKCPEKIKQLHEYHKKMAKHLNK